MRMEDHFKQTLDRAVEHEPPVLDAWDRFEHRLGRARRWRMVAGLAGAAAVIVAAVIVVPQLGTEGVRVIPPDATPSEGPYQGWGSFEDPIGEWRLMFPPTWRVTDFEGVKEVLPPGEIGTAAGEPTFAVIVSRLDEDLEPSAADEFPVQRGTWGNTERPYIRIQILGTEGTVGHIYRIDWRPPCAFQSAPCEIAPATLVVQVYSSDQERLDRYGDDGDLIARSLEYTKEFTPSSPSPS